MSPKQKQKKKKEKTTSTSKIPAEYKLMAKAMGINPEDYINLPQLVAQQRQQIDLLATKMNEIYDYFQDLKTELAARQKTPQGPPSRGNPPLASIPPVQSPLPPEPTEGPPKAPSWIKNLFSGKEGKELVKEIIKGFTGPAVDEGTLKLAKAIQAHMTKAATVYAKKLMSEIGKEGFMEKLE